MSNAVTESPGAVLTQDAPFVSGSALPSHSEEMDEDGLGSHPMWPDFLAALAAIHQADRERDEREYAE